MSLRQILFQQGAWGGNSIYIPDKCVLTASCVEDLRDVVARDIGRNVVRKKVKKHKLHAVRALTTFLCGKKLEQE